MSRQRRLVFVVGIALVAFRVAAAGSGVVTLAPACDGAGFSGTYSRDGSSVRFQVCRSDLDTRARFWKTDETTLLEIREVPVSGITIFIAGIEYTDKITEEQRQRMNAALQSPEGRLIPDIYHELKSLGMQEGTPQMDCLGATLMIYEGAK